MRLHIATNVASCGYYYRLRAAFLNHFEACCAKRNICDVRNAVCFALPPVPYFSEQDTNESTQTVAIPSADSENMIKRSSFTVHSSSNMTLALVMQAEVARKWNDRLDLRIPFAHLVYHSSSFLHTPTLHMYTNINILKYFFFSFFVT